MLDHARPTAGWRCAQSRARGRGAQAKLRAAAKLEQLADRCEKVAQQISKRVAGEPINDRLVSLSDPDARPIRKGKLGKPNEFGYVTQLAEVTENTRRGARGLILPASTAPGNPAENTLLPDTVTELKRLGLSPREVALDGGFKPGPTKEASRSHTRAGVHLRPPATRLQTHPTTAAALPHRKRRAASATSNAATGLGRSRLKGDEGQQIWTGWAILTYNADTLAIRARWNTKRS